MALKKFIPQVDYGLTNALQTLPPQVVVSPSKPGLAGRAPTIADTNYAIGTEWVHTTDNTLYVLTSISNAEANWFQIAENGGGADFLFIELPNTTAGFTSGFIAFGGVPFISDYGTANTFVGTGSGNATLTVGNATDNTGVGNGALADLTTGAHNTVEGSSAGGALTTGSDNTAIGYRALFTATTSNFNTAVGSLALSLNTGGSNVAVGDAALETSSTGSNSTAVGANALTATTTGTTNTAVGSGSLSAITTSSANIALGVNAGALLATGAGNNTFIGHQAGNALLTGSSNLIVGFQAGQAYVGAESSNILIANNGVAAESNVMRIGTTGGGAGQVAKCFVAGTRGVTTDANDAIAVLISSTGQLGTTSSSARKKAAIQDMGDYSSKLLDARPVTFYYKSDKSKERVPGLIAEEFAELYPDMVVYDDEGRPETIQYQELPAMLLNEIKKLHARIAALEAK